MLFRSEILDCNNFEEENKDKKLMQFLSKESDYLKILAINNLEKVPLTYISAMLTEDEEIVRLAALKSLAKHKEKNVLSLIFRSCYDISDIIRGESAKILGNLGFKESVDVLWKLLEDQSDFVRKESCEAIEKLTKKSFGYSHSASKLERDEKKRLWQDWWQSNKKKR